MISSEFSSVLKSGRTDFNNRFALARRIYASLRAEEFSSFLETAVDPLVRLVATIDKNRISTVAYAAYDIALALVGQNLAGPGSKYQFIEEGWEKILHPAVKHVVHDPEKVITCVSNALYNIAATQGADLSMWQETLGMFSTITDDIDTFLKIGQILSWKAGLAHYRNGSLILLDTLPEKMSRSIMRINDNKSWIQIREQLGQDPWFNPSDTDETIKAKESGFRITARVGEFRGFGGLFIEPPLVATIGEEILVKSGTECWLLMADIFGATFHRVEVSEFDKAAQKTSMLSDIKINGTKIRFKGEIIDIKHLGSISSAARNNHTLALTSPLSHSVFLMRIS